MRAAVVLVVCLLAATSALGEKGPEMVLQGTSQGNIALYVCSYLGGGEGRLVKFDAQTAEKLAELSGVAQPVDADVGQDGAVFVTDESSTDVRRFDPQTGQADDDPYGETSSPDYLGGPRGLALDLDGHLYVADMTYIPGEVVVVEFDENGKFVRDLPDDSENPVLLAIEDVACDASGRIYVTQWYDDFWCKNPGVFRFTGSGWSLFGETDDLTYPYGLTFGPDGDLYVAEDSSPEAAGIYRYDETTGASKGLYGETGSRDNLVHPRYLTFGPDGDLYVTDSQDSTVRKFSGPLKPDAGAFKSVFCGASPVAEEPIRGLVFGPAGRPELLVEKLENGDMLLTLTGLEGKTYELRYTSDRTFPDFTEWTLGATISLEGETSDTWTDDSAWMSSTRFYSAEEQ